MPRGSSILGALFFVLAALLLYTSLPFGWGGGDAADGTRYKLSPIQLSHVLQPNQTVSATEDCRIHDANPAERCRVAAGGEGAFTRLQLVRPLVLIGALICLLAALLAFMNGGPRQLRLIVGVIAGAIPASAMILFSFAAQPALEALANTDFGLAATRGTMQLILAIALPLGATALVLRSRLRPVPAMAAIGTLLVLPFAGLRFGGWPGVMVGFGLGLAILVATLRPARVVGSPV